MSMQQLEDELLQKVKLFIAINTKAWLYDTVVKSAKSFSRAANMPKSFVDNIKIGIVEGEYALVNYWNSKDDKPLAIFFEHGTVDHYIKPKKPGGVLAWPASSGSHGSAIYYQSGIAPGTMLFSKGHYVTGLPKLEPMHRGYDVGIKKFGRKVKREVKQKFSKDTDEYKIRVSV